MRIDLLIPLKILGKYVMEVLNDLDLDIIGIDTSSNDAGLALESMMKSVGRTLAVIPRRIYVSSERDPVAPRSMTRRYLVLYIPTSTSAARALAKVRSLTTIALSPETIRFVDETQVNFMATSKRRKLVEVLLGDFIELAKPGHKISFERALHFMCKAIDRALYLDVGVVVSSGLRNFLHPSQLRAILFHLGYTKRERELLTQVYPIELVKEWMRC